MKTYAKAIVAVLIAGVTAAQAALTDGITGQEWLTVALAVLTAVGVYLVPNAPKTDTTR